MHSDRWTLAVDADVIDAPTGRVLAMLARGDADLGALAAADQLVAVQGFRPDFDQLAARGITVVPDLDEVDGAGDGASEGFEAALVQIVKSKPATLSAIAEALAALRPGGLLMVDGAKVEGIESVLKTLKANLPVDGVFSKAHGKLIWLTRPDALPAALADWVAAPQVVEGGYVTVPGGFSSDGPDRGSELLVALMPPLKGRVADLGAGWGYLAAEILGEQDGIDTLDLVEADAAMLAAAEANVDDPRASFLWADVRRFAPAEKYDAVISNPPFHTERAADPSLGRAFIAAAARLLKPSGRFFMVANRHLPYEAALKDAFATGRLIGELEGYKLYEAAKPRR